jgi:hypothetical protein
MLTPSDNVDSCMKRSVFLLLAFLVITGLSAQDKVYHFLYAHYGASLTKQTYMGGYSIGYRRVTYNLNVGYARGTDNHFLAPEDIGNNKLEGEISASAVVKPSPRPADSYLEEVNSTYNGPQVRLGITCFLRRNDTLGRRPFSGPHAGLEASYMRVTEMQSVTYRSKTSEQRWVYDGGNRFHAVGAVSHIGWQFALLHERLYIDTRFVVPFLYPFTDDPNINSPFAGTRYEFQVSAAWHIGWGKSDEEIDASPKAKVRDKI